MNPENSKTPRQALEAQLTALLLGELPEDHAAALREVLNHDAELARLHQRLKQTIDLVREASASSAEQQVSQPAPLKLSDQRRQKLLAQFKTIKPKEFAEQRRLGRSLVTLAAVLAIAALLAAIAIPNFVKSRSTSIANATINNLRQLDGPAQQWALEKHKSASDTPTPSYLAPYFVGGKLPAPVS